MSTAKQYGFYIDSSKCTGCKTCQLSCKDNKDLGIDRNFRRVYEYVGGNWTEERGAFRQNVFAYYLSISCNHCTNQRVPRFVHQVQCTSVKKTALLLLMKACVSAVNLVTWHVLTARLNTAKKKVT